jgi:hypothetical protein
MELAEWFAINTEGAGRRRGGEPPGRRTEGA